jgi:uncharacterized membrane protein YhaH (DUF805 family)
MKAMRISDRGKKGWLVLLLLLRCRYEMLLFLSLLPHMQI